MSASVRQAPSRWAVLAWAIAGLTLAVVAATSVLSFTNRALFENITDANLLEVILPIGFTIVGGLVASRMPRNRLGWVFLAISLANAIPGLAIQYSVYALYTNPGAPFSAWIPWTAHFSDSLVYPSGLAVLGLLLIPNGRFLSDRWRLLAWAGALLTVAYEFTVLADPNAIEFRGHIDNPTGIAALSGLSSGPIGYAVFLGALGILVLAGASVILRLIRAKGDERLQLRWVAYAVVFAELANVAATLFFLFVGPRDEADLATTITTILGFGFAMPVSFGVAILRYRLYDLDLLLNRTVVYGAVSLVLVVAVAVADVVLQRAMESAFHQRSELVSVGLGLGAGFAFGPLRRRLRPMVDRFLPARSRQTLLFTDIVASTQALVDLGDERWRALLDQFRASVRHQLARYRGREVNTAGDAFFAAFDRPRNAVWCAEGILAAVQALGLRVRIGLHVGEVEMRGEQLSGLAVHAAARVMGQAGDDQILVSSELAQLLGKDVPLTDAGRHALKGVPGEWHLYAVGSA